MPMQKMNRERRQAGCCRASNLGKGVGESFAMRKSRRTTFAILSINAIAIAQIFLLCSIFHHNIQYSNSLMQQNTQMTRVSTAKWRRSRGILRPYSILASEAISTERDVASPTNSFASSVKISYKPSRQCNKKYHQVNKKYHRDFRTHEDHDRVQLDWMVRNTAKILGEDASPLGVSQQKLTI